MTVVQDHVKDLLELLIKFNKNTMEEYEKVASDSAELPQSFVQRQAYLNIIKHACFVVENEAQFRTLLSSIQRTNESRLKAMEKKLEDTVKFLGITVNAETEIAVATDIQLEMILTNWPLNTGFISSTWGPREEPTAGTGTFHSGLDIAVPNGTPVYATSNGTVTQIATHPNYGNVVVITMNNGLITADMHLQTINVTINSLVVAGQQIGITGTTGTFTTGGHDHFSVWDNANNVPNFGNNELMVTRETINPESVLPARPSTIAQ